MQLSVLRILQMLVKSDIGSEAEIVVVQINHLLIRVNSKVFLLLCIFTLLLRTLGLGSCICIGLFQTVIWSQVGVSFVWRWGVNRIGYKSLWASHKFLGWCSVFVLFVFGDSLQHHHPAHRSKSWRSTVWQLWICGLPRGPAIYRIQETNPPCWGVSMAITSVVWPFHSFVPIWLQRD